MHDHYPHRSLPLSKGCLEGDAVRCGYHGLLFAPDGACIDAPPVDRPPRAMHVRGYTLVERGPLVWIWTGSGPSNNPQATETMRAGALKAFAEDAEALEAIAQMQVADPDYRGMSMKSDQAGVAMRRILKSFSLAATAHDPCSAGLN